MGWLNVMEAHKNLGVELPVSPEVPRFTMRTRGTDGHPGQLEDVF